MKGNYIGTHIGCKMYITVLCQALKKEDTQKKEYDLCFMYIVCFYLQKYV